jgi:hypothetical protein
METTISWSFYTWDEYVMTPLDVRLPCVWRQFTELWLGKKKCPGEKVPRHAQKNRSKSFAGRIWKMTND